MARLYRLETSDRSRTATAVTSTPFRSGLPPLGNQGHNRDMDVLDDIFDQAQPLTLPSEEHIPLASESIRGKPTTQSTSERNPSFQFFSPLRHGELSFGNVMMEIELTLLKLCQLLLILGSQPISIAYHRIGDQTPRKTITTSHSEISGLCLDPSA